MKSKEIILVLDFDGVICNSIHECLITSYNAFYETRVNNFSEIPNNVKNYFYKYRFYVRPANEYYLVHKAYQKCLIDFDYKTFCQLKSKYNNEIKLFEKRFFNERVYLRKNKERWLSLHKMYDHVKDFFRLYKKKFFIVTTKDKSSVEMLSEYFGLGDFIWDVFSKELSTKKNDLFNILFRNYEKEVKNKQLVYVDDNEWHLGDIQRLDVKLFFANWGYSGKQVQHSFKAIRTLKEIYTS